MPGDVGGVVSHEIAHIQGVPERLVPLMRLRLAGQLDQGFAFAGFHLGIGIGGAAPQHAQSGFVQVFQQLAFPGVPDFGAGAPDVGHGEQVQGGQAALIADALCKTRNDFRAAQVFLLGHMAHGQVFTDQEFDQLGVLFVDLVLAAEGAYFGAAQL